MKYLVPALAAGMLAAPVVSAAKDTKPEASEQVADKSQNRMICKKDKLTGSRLQAKKTCMTAAQWEQLERDQREATERAQANRPREGT